MRVAVKDYDVVYSKLPADRFWLDSLGIDHNEEELQPLKDETEGDSLERGTPFLHAGRVHGRGVRE